MAKIKDDKENTHEHLITNIHGPLIKTVNELYYKEKMVLQRKILLLISDFEKRHQCVLAHSSSDREQLTIGEIAEGKIAHTINFSVDFIK